MELWENIWRTEAMHERKYLNKCDKRLKINNA